MSLLRRFILRASPVASAPLWRIIAMSFIFTVEVFEVVLGSNWLVDGVHSVVVWSGWGEEKIVNGDIICVLSEFVGFCVSIRHTHRLSCTCRCALSISEFRDGHF
jgi:hypothetical protein